MVVVAPLKQENESDEKAEHERNQNVAVVHLGNLRYSQTSPSRQSAMTT